MKFGKTGSQWSTRRWRNVRETAGHGRMETVSAAMETQDGLGGASKCRDFWGNLRIRFVQFNRMNNQDGIPGGLRQLLTNQETTENVPRQGLWFGRLGFVKSPQNRRQPSPPHTLFHFRSIFSCHFPGNSIRHSNGFLLGKKFLGNGEPPGNQNTLSADRT